MLLINVSLLSSLKPYQAKYKIAGIGVLQGISLAICGMDCIDFTKKKKKKEIRILGVHSCYNKKLETEENFIRHVWKKKK